VKLVELRAAEAKVKQAEAKAKEASAQPDDPKPEEVEVAKRSYLLLFEEPELFLHPDAQRILFEALGRFAVDHHVVVTTHSPLFLGPEATATFVRIAKHTDAAFPKPYSIAHPVDLSVLGQKDAFQIICFENNNAAFFAKKIVLVEGDSDQIIFPHIAQLLEPNWTCARHSVAFVQIGGKGSIRRYREFFALFNVAVYVIADLDLLLKGFRILNADASLQKLQTDLVALLDREITAVAGKNTQELKEANKSGEIKVLWARAKLAKAAYDKDRTPENLTSMTDAVDAFFAWETNDERLRLLGESTTAEIVAAKLALLEKLRKQNVFVLSRGAIEEYYPQAILSGEKPARAQQFRKRLRPKKASLRAAISCRISKI
jgi:putative ATP-dependent endonuclease of the OLD family